MISASQDFINAVSGNGRTFKAKIIHDSEEVACSIVEIKMSKGANDGETFSIGSVFSSSVEISVRDLSVPLENEDILLQIGVLTDAEEGTYEYIDYGVFTVIKVAKNTSGATLTAVGGISAKLNVPFPDTINAPTIQTVATTIYETSGIPVSFVGFSGLNKTLATTLTGITCRGALEIIAFLVGGFATENNSGGVEIHKYTMPSTLYDFPPGRSLTEPETAGEAFEMTGIKVIVNAEMYILTQDTTVQSGKTYYERTGSGTTSDPYDYEEVENPTGNPHTKGYYELSENAYESGDPIRQVYQSEYMTSEIFTMFAQNVVGYEFMPASVDMSLGDPLLEPWDVLDVTDGDGESYEVPCHLIESYFDGGFSNVVIATAESESDGDVEGPVAKQIGDLSGQLAVTQLAATSAKAAAKSAERSAEAASAILEEMEDAAEAAGTTLTQIYADAESAAESAEQAKEDATTANMAANGAIRQLSVVEDVLGTLTWIAQHGEYTETFDTEVMPAKYYFEYDSVTDTYSVANVSTDKEPYPIYTLTSDTAIVTDKVYYTVTATTVSSPATVDLYLYYERSANTPYTYTLTSDTVVQSGKTYYTLVGTEVVTPDISDIGQYYERTIGEHGENPSLLGLYELSGVNEAIENYISTHLALDNVGLHVTNDDGNGSLLLSENGVEIINELGATVAIYGENTIIGDTDTAHIRIGPTTDGPRLSFYDGNQEVAYITNNQLYIPRVVVVDAMQVGDAEDGAWQWRIHGTTRNLRLVWIGGN